MRRPFANKLDRTASTYRRGGPLPTAEHLRWFACECRILAQQETNPARRELFRQMESAWEAVAAQVERADDLNARLQAMRCASLN